VLSAINKTNMLQVIMLGLYDEYLYVVCSGGISVIMILCVIYVKCRK
jgi:Mg2+ and Co2+ transporter CorA